MTRGIPGSTPGHGTHARYVAGCRCADCRAARAAYQKRSNYARIAGRPGLVPSIGTTRRLRALARLGWPPSAIGSQLQWTQQYVQQLRRTEQPTVERATATRVAALYDALGMTPGPSDRTRRHAERCGWPSPLAWDEGTIDDPTARPDSGSRVDLAVDDAVIDRVMAGEAQPTNVAEREVLVPRLHAKGLSDGEIAALCQVWDETVTRIRKRLGVGGRYAAA